MNRRDAEKLKVGDKVLWSDNTRGEVVDKGYVGFTVKWDDGQIGIVQFDNTGDLLNQIRASSKKAA